MQKLKRLRNIAFLKVRTLRQLYQKRFLDIHSDQKSKIFLKNLAIYGFSLLNSSSFDHFQIKHPSPSRITIQPPTRKIM